DGRVVLGICRTWRIYMSVRDSAALTRSVSEATQRNPSLTLRVSAAEFCTAIWKEIESGDPRRTPNLFCCVAARKIPKSPVGLPVLPSNTDGQFVRVADEPDVAGAAGTRPDRPGGLGGFRCALRAEDLRLVPRPGSARGGRRRCHPERAGAPRGEDADVRLRSVGQLSRLAQGADASCLERLCDRSEARGDGQRRQPDLGMVAHR